MSLRNIFTNLFELCTGLPSKATFIKKHVVPAKPGDKFYNDRCGICWGDYDAEHPRAKIPCGHIFCLGCIHDMMKSPDGGVCPYCRKKLFRPGLIKLVGNLLVPAIVIYSSVVLRMIDPMTDEFEQMELQLIEQGLLWLSFLLEIAIEGPAAIMFELVSEFTNLGIRNSKHDLMWVFEASVLMPQLLQVGALFAPILLPVYLVLGLHRFLWTYFVIDFLLNLGSHIEIWWFSFRMAHIRRADRATVKFLSAVTFVAREIEVFLILVPGALPVALRFVWAVLGAVLWR
jgi:hypothetical protein